MCPRMLILMLFIQLVVSQLLNQNGTQEVHVPDEQRLLENVFSNYDNKSRPVYNATDHVIVTFGLTLIQIIDVDERNQVLSANVWLDHEWHDPRIQWDPRHYNNLQVIRIPSYKLWLPDIVLYNNADDFTAGYMPTNVMVFYDGSVFWSPTTRLRCSCKIDVTYFPFDQQECRMKFGSWMYDRAQVDVAMKLDQADLSFYVSNGEWAMVRSQTVRNEVVYPISTAVYPDVTISVTIHRLTLFYFINIILPCLWQNALSLLTFSLPPDADEKITLGTTVLLSCSFFTLLVADFMPPTSEFVPMISIYLAISMTTTALSVILSVVVLKVHHHGTEQIRIPRWIRFLVLTVLARIVCCERKNLGKSSSGKTGNKSTKKNKTFPRSYNEKMCLRLINELDMRRYSPLADLRSLYNNVNTEMDAQPPEEHADMNVRLLLALKEQTIMEESLKCLQTMAAKREEDDQGDEVDADWRQVALIVDKFFFWLFLLAILAVTLGMMVFTPVIRQASLS